MPTFTEAQQKGFAYGPKPAAVISFLSSLYLCTLISSDVEKRKKVYHRIVFAMSANSVLQSGLHFWGTWAFPKETPGAYNAVGTVNTCSIQGAMLQFTFVVPFYYASLSLFSVIAIRTKFSEKVLRRVEPFIHLGVYIFPLSSATFLVITKRLNPAGATCFIASFPWNCENEEDVECTRGSDDITDIGWLLAGLPIFFFLFFATFMMVIVYWMILRIERKKERMVGKTRFLEDARKKKSSIVAWQATLYLMTFYGTYAFAIISAMITNATGTIVAPISIIGHIMLPAQGFLTMIVYIRLLVKRQKRSMRSNPAITSRSNWSLNQNSNVMMASIAAAVDRQNQSHVSTEFSIFDGTNPSDQWKEFFCSDDSEEDDFESNSNQRSNRDPTAATANAAVSTSNALVSATNFIVEPVKSISQGPSPLEITRSPSSSRLDLSA